MHFRSYSRQCLDVRCRETNAETSVRETERESLKFGTRLSEENVLELHL